MKETDKLTLHMSRRTAIAVGVGVVTGVGIGFLAAETARPKQTRILTEVKPTVIPNLTVLLAATEIPLPQLSKNAMVFASDYTIGEKRQFVTQVLREKENILKNRYEGVALYPDKKAVTDLMPKISSIAASLSPAVDPFIAQILPGLIFIESKGNPNPPSKGAAVGLCQITPIVLEELEQVTPGVTKGKDMLQSDDNIEIAIRYLQHLYTIFPDKALAVWAYHIGQKQMAKAIINYLMFEEKRLTTQEYNLLKPPQTVALIRRYKDALIVPQLMLSTSMNIAIDEQYTDEGLRIGALSYVPLIAAGNELLAA